MIIVFAQAYDKKAGIGTIISMMLPYSMTFLITWSILFIAWVSAGIPLDFNKKLLILIEGFFY